MIKVVLIEDYDILRLSIKDIINECEGYEVVGDFESYESAFPFIKGLKPNIILTDITLPGIDGIEGIKKVKQILPKVLIIVLTVHDQSKYVFDAICAGAVGYLTKNAEKQKIVDALNQVQQGGAPMSINIARMVIESFQNKNNNNLTQRENEVLNLLSQGKSYTTIAKQLFLSINTIKTHVKNIYEKLQVTSRDELINRKFN